MALTDEQRAARAAALAKGRERAAANRAAKAAAPDEPPVVMPPIVHEDAGPLGDPAAASTGAAASESFSTQNGPDTIEGADDFERFLLAQDDETRSVLSDVELRVIFETETKRAAEERKVLLKKAVATRALRHARATAGLIPAEAIAAQSLRDRMSQKVQWIINMPEAGNSGTLIDQGVRIDGKLYVHGQSVTGTLAEYISYREIEGRAHENERQFQGRSRMAKLSQTGMRFLNNEGHA
jgi:hypothetical protein